MATWVWLALSCVIVVEIFVRIEPLEGAREMAEIGRKAAHVIASGKISDHWKEQALPLYAQRLLVASLLMFSKVLLVLSPFFVLGIVAGSFGVPLLRLAASLPGVIASCLIAIAYGRVRATFV